MLYAIDVHYDALRASARAALVGFEAWTSAHTKDEAVAAIASIEEYVPGEFYRRELPPLLEVLRRASYPISVLVVDGHVWLDREGRPGLGAHVHAALHGQTPVVGVAKSAFHGADLSLPVLRGNSRKALYVSAIGMDASEAVRAVASMRGEHRIPTLLRRVDQLARGTENPARFEATHE